MSAIHSGAAKSLRDRLDARLRVMPNGCWNWTGYVPTPGYARVSVKGKQFFVHRLMYELHVGPIPDGLEIDHLCRNRMCARPSHLEPVTHVENVRRAIAGQTHCKSGHEFTSENTRVTSRQRICRVCDRIRAARKRAEVAAA